MKNVKRRCTATLLTVLAVLYSGCASDPDAQAVVTEAEARNLLTRIVDDVVAGGPDAACEYAASEENCRTHLADAGDPPDAEPHVDCVLELDTVGDRTGGVILVVSGTDGDRAPYRSEVLVTRTDAGLRSLTPVYWGGVSVDPARAQVTPLAGGDCR